MNSLYIPLLLLNLTKQETQLLLLLYLIHENKDKKEVYTFQEIAIAMGLKKDSPVIEDLLNRLMVRNIVGRMQYNGIADPTIKENFDSDFLTVLYDKSNPFKSAKQKAGFYIEDITTVFVLNPVTRSWKYLPKAQVVRTLKKLKKVADDSLIEYLLKSFDNNGNNKRKESNARLNGWSIQHAMDSFKRKYKIRYGNDYILNNSNREYKYMKDLLIEFSKNSISKDKFDPFLDYAFDEAINRDYVLKIVGLKYYANEYLTKVGAK